MQCVAARYLNTAWNRAKYRAGIFFDNYFVINV